MAEPAHLPPPVTSSRPRVPAEESLRTFRLLEALRSYGDPNKPSDANELIALIKGFPQLATVPSGDQATQTEPGLTTPLHLAVQTARLPAVTLALQTRPTDINARNKRGQTPLHLACMEGRTDVVAAFMASPIVDDQIKDSAGRTCAEVARNVEVVNLVQVSRAQLNSTYADLLLAYVASPLDAPIPSPTRDQLFNWISKPRSRGLDFDLKAPGRGTTVLHEAARRRDLELLKLCHSKGADLLVRDAKGKMPSDVTKDEKTKAFLRTAITAEGRKLKSASNSFMRSEVSLSGSSIASGAATVSHGKPSYRSGYLAKWVNVAKGYSQRWFVLQNGLMTYYRSQEDEGRASRGSVSLAHARVTGPHNDKLKFEVTSNIAKSGKWWIKANHPLEAIRWVEDIKTHIEYAKTGTTIDLPTPSRSVSTSMSSPPDDPLELPRIAQKNSSMYATQMSSNVPDPRGPPSFDDGMADDDDNGSIFTFGDDGAGSAAPPHEESYHIVANSAKAQLEATEQLLESFGISPHASRPSSLVDGRHAHTAHVDDSHQTELKKAIQQSLRKLSDILDEHLEQAGERETWYMRRYEREMDAKRLWEETTRQVAAEQAEIEEKLRKVTQDSSRRKKALKEMRMSLLTDQIDSNADAVTAAALSQGPPGNVIASPSPPMSATSALATSPARSRGMSSATVRSPALMPHFGSAGSSRLAEENLDDDDDSDSGEEFFDMIDANAVPLKTDEALMQPDAHPLQNKELPISSVAERVEDFEPYKKLRTELPIKADNRPPISLWAVLKGSIGKDLTKISFPVYFNEPTSMLQRMAEDMEFSECLDAAAHNPDSTKRIAYVAAFAMSNYSSTQGRIAKPFNALLSETFEYARPDRHYRYISEQVSHHPPISACIGEAPEWRYFGEVDAKSKFTGKSFEIRPTGNAHAMLYLPKQWCPNYPPDLRSEGRNKDAKVVEHYSWRKVTTSVSNFILGSPQIDHYGDMEITNHRTGEKCVLTFKPRGWRGKDAYEIKGQVTDAKGQTTLEIAGRWNSQLIARRPVEGNLLAPDLHVTSPTSPSQEQEYILLWRNSVKPPGSPFNLTPYAITLNGITSELRPWLPPTDCRLRPDQHFFESGAFEKANDLKTSLEEYQRGTRRKRERGELPPHKPRWFTRRVEADTKEGYWAPNETKGVIDYWAERGRVNQAREAGESVTWEGAENIFGQYADLVSV